MSKLNVCVLFGGVSPEHDVSLRSAESVLNNMDAEKYNIFPLGITKEGEWILYNSTDYSQLPTGQWLKNPTNCSAVISPVRGQGLIIFDEHGYHYKHLDVVFPVMHGENCEDGAMQGLLQIAGIPYVGPHVSASAVAMDKTLTKLVADCADIPQAGWILVKNSDLAQNVDTIVNNISDKFTYPVFVKPAGTGSSVGVSKVNSAEELENALRFAGRFDEKILVEEFVDGQEVEVDAGHIATLRIGVYARRAGIAGDVGMATMEGDVAAVGDGQLGDVLGCGGIHHLDEMGVVDDGP